MYYIDTGILVAYYSPEALSEQVQTFLDSQLKPAISRLTEVELFSAVAKKVRMGELSHADGNLILSKFLSHIESGLFTIINPEAQHWKIARSWISLFTTSLRTLDALHLAIASAEDYVLVTSDQQLLRAAKTLDVKTFQISAKS